MTDARLLFLGRTGVGKSSLINFLAGEERCDTDPYRACTKEPTIVTAKYGENEYDLIDTPGLCEGGDELDSLYLGLIDRYLLDDKVSPNLVFKSDDSRLRSEDYQLIKVLLSRYGNRIFKNCALMLTFAGNLPAEYHLRIHKRVKLITTAIYGIQTSLGMEIFNGFPRITLVDSELGSFFDVTCPANSIDLTALVSAIERNQHEEVAQKLGVHPEISESILNALKSGKGKDLDINGILNLANQFPFHNLIEEPSASIPSTSATKPKMTEEPKSVYELAQLLNADGFDETLINIDSGFLTITRTIPYRKLLDSDRYADCISVVAYSMRNSQGKLTYTVHYKIAKHKYKDDESPDVDAIFKSADEAASAIFFKPDSYRNFVRLVGHPEFLLNTGLFAFRNAVEEALTNQEVWNE